MSFDKDMDIHSPQGTKVVFTANGGMDGEIKYAKEQLVLGEIYTVRRTEVHSWSTDVYLEEFPDNCFNSCLFDEYVEKTIEKYDNYYEGTFNEPQPKDSKRIEWINDEYGCRVPVNTDPNNVFLLTVEIEQLKKNEEKWKSKFEKYFNMVSRIKFGIGKVMRIVEEEKT